MNLIPKPPGWAEADHALVKEYAFDSFSRAMAFMFSAVPLIETMNHHPEWTNVYNRVRVCLSTHDAGHTITDLDRQLAMALDRHYEAVVGNDPIQ